MSDDILTAFELNKQMVAKSEEIDTALLRYRDVTREWVEASRQLRQNTAIQYAKGVAGKNQAEREAAMNSEIEEFVFAEERLKAEREIGKEYIRAKTAQLSALQSQAGALREELRLVRTGPQEGP
jgi:hypothetical protein